MKRDNRSVHNKVFSGSNSPETKTSEKEDVKIPMMGWNEYLNEVSQNKKVTLVPNKEAKVQLLANKEAKVLPEK